ncbi:hypothetical protein M422DRAFT_39266 [Sphaerobolus stellatus SS14]|uniref:Uncharacterized protein n=1 Tax=Sphaerobolus stellatus (strain SS14) TaxID=990650 RepID=A0A0C9UG19_SPHS4|nr:hypothetical protein M422DRAFT_39266 [Sphaerobolus stellatus SS14]
MHYTFQAIYSSHPAFTTIFSNAIRYKVAEASRSQLSSQALLLLSNQKTGIPSALLKSMYKGYFVSFLLEISWSR